MLNDLSRLSAQIGVGVLRRYLRSNGWLDQTLENDRTDLFYLEKGGRKIVELFIPKLESSEGSSKYKLLALQTLSDFYGKDPIDAFKEIRAIGFDIMYASIPSDAIMWQSVYLETAEGFLRHTRKLLAYAAMADEDSARYYHAVSDIGDNYAGRCRLGHTMNTSFGFVIESPVGPHSEFRLDERQSPPPPERRHMQRIVRGIVSIREAYANRDPSHIISNYTSAFNANMCDELMRILNSSESNRVRFDFKFSPEWRQGEEYNLPEPIELKTDVISLLKEASAALRQVEVDPTVSIEGKIVVLSSRESPADLEHAEASREFAIEYLGADGIIKVRLRVDPATFKAAYEAYGKGLTAVARGKLEQQGRSWRLKEPHDIRFV